MSHEQRRLDVRGEVAQVGIVPGRLDTSKETGLFAIPVPADAEPVAIGGRLLGTRGHALVDEVVFRLEKQRFILIIILHHLIADQYSVRILVEEMLHFYRNLVQENSLTLPDLPIHYIDFSKWQKEMPLKFSDYLLTYWKKELRGKLKTLELPTDKPRAFIHLYNSALQTFALSESLSKKILFYCKKENVSPFVTLLGIFKILFYQGLALVY